MARARTRCIREREALRSAPSKLCTQRPGFRKDPGLFHFQLQNGLRIGTDQRSMDRTTAYAVSRSLTSCRKTISVLADGSSCNLRGCSSAGRARPRHGRGHEFETRHPLHFGCVLALRCRDAPGCARRGMCQGGPRNEPALVQRDTPLPSKRRQCSRSGTAEVEDMPA